MGVFDKSNRLPEKLAVILCKKYINFQKKDSYMNGLKFPTKLSLSVIMILALLVVFYGPIQRVGRVKNTSSSELRDTLLSIVNGSFTSGNQVLAADRTLGSLQQPMQNRAFTQREVASRTSQEPQGFNSTSAPFSATQFGFVADGYTATPTDNTAAWNTIYNACGNIGCIIEFPVGAYYFSQSINIKKPIKLIGAGSGSPADNGNGVGTVLLFPQGSNGLTFTLGALGAGLPNHGALNSVMQGFQVEAKGGYHGFNTGTGITVQAGVQFTDIYIKGFAEDGLFVDSTGSTPSNPKNANGSTFINIRTYFNKKSGIHIAGSDSNAMTCINCRATLSGEWGFLNEGYDNLFLQSLAEFNGHLFNGTSFQANPGFYDYKENGGSNSWLNPYSESDPANGVSKFYFGNNASFTKYTARNFGAPELVFASAGTALAGHIIDSQGYQNQIALDDPMFTAAPWRRKYVIKSSYLYDSGALNFIDETGNTVFQEYRPNTTTNLWRGGIVYEPVTIKDLPQGGSIGKATETVDKAGVIIISQSSKDQSITLPAPTVPSVAGRVIMVTHNGTEPTKIQSKLLKPEETITFVWDGNSWNGTTPNN